MAKLYASEAGKEIVEDAVRIRGGYWYSRSSRSSASTGRRRCC
jgi:alkylation response protein AidB-like acyl-CoA dehydrogenase